jgi:hypothetical protein
VSLFFIAETETTFASIKESSTIGVMHYFAGLLSDTKIHYILTYSDLCNLSNKLAAFFLVNFDLKIVGNFLQIGL